MASVSVASARQFVLQAEIPSLPRTRGLATPAVDLVFDAAKNQAAVVGSDIVSFVKGVSEERREAIVNSSLLAQLVAKKKVPDASQVVEWYDAYFDVLTNIGWVIQDKGFAEYREQAQNFDVHKAILAVATTLLGAAPTALALVKVTLESLQSMNEDSPWITLFNRETQSARSARFQVSLADEAPDGAFVVTMMAFSLEAKATLTQVLFFKAKANEATLKHASGKVTINTAVLDGVSSQIKGKLVSAAQDFVKTLPDL